MVDTRGAAEGSSMETVESSQNGFAAVLVRDTVAEIAR
jgi:hypothetical protein